jgi:hypothetical protein
MEILEKEFNCLAFKCCTTASCFFLFDMYDDFMSTIFLIGFKVTIAKTILQNVECGRIFLVKCYKCFSTIIQCELQQGVPMHFAKA